METAGHHWGKQHRPGRSVSRLHRGGHGDREKRRDRHVSHGGFHLQPHSKLIINTRSETAMDKPLFRQSMLERRCLIPCSWYFEWETRDAQQIQPANQPTNGKGKNAQKIKYAIRPKAPGIIYLAGIYRYEDNQKLPVLSILTREPAPEIAFIHDRMPVIFSDRHHGAWLDRNADPMEALTLCEKEMAFRAA